MVQGAVSKKQAKKDYAAAFQAVQAVLFKDWNPLGIEDESDAHGAYKAFAAQVVFLAKTGASGADIAGHLAHLGIKQLGLSAKAPKHRSRCKKSGEAVVRTFKKRK